jgi:hypothetical protein
MVGWVCWTWVSHIIPLFLEDRRVHESFDFDCLVFSPVIIAEEDKVNTSSNPTLILNSKLVGGHFCMHLVTLVTFLDLLDLEQISENTLDMILDWWVLSNLVEVSTEENWLICEVIFEEFSNNG